MKIHLKILILYIILAGAGYNLLAQKNKTPPRYTSEIYNISFEIPKDSVKQPGATRERTVFAGREDIFGTSSLEFVAQVQNEAAQLSQILSTDEGAEGWAALVVEQARSITVDEIKVLERARVKIGGLRALKLVTQVWTVDGKKISSALFVVPVPEHKRVYSFVVSGSGGEFYKWLDNAQKTIDSFELVKTKPLN